MLHLYALRHIESQKFLVLNDDLSSYEDPEPDIIHELDLPTEERQVIWTTQDLEHAIFVRSVSAADAYSSSFQYPMHDFKPEELEIVYLITCEVIEVPTLPSELEVMDVLTSISRYSSDKRIEELRNKRTYTWLTYQRYLEKLHKDGY